MKLAKIKSPTSRFRVQYKLFDDNQNISDDYQLIAQNAYQALYQYAIFEDGKFDYEDNQKEGIIVQIDKIPYIFSTKDNYIVEQLPFETKIDVNQGHIFVRGIFAIERNAINQCDEMRQQFENHVKNDLKQNIEKQIQDLQSAKKFL